MNDQPRWLSVFNDLSTSSFVDVLRRDHPHLLAESRLRPEDVVTIPHGTTVLSVSYRDGVIMAGDRQATAGYQVASRRIEKIFKADDYSGVGIAGAAGPAVEMAKLFQTELEHYEKVEGDNLSLEGKANKLGQMIRMNLPMAMQGLAVVPIFAGFDVKTSVGRLFKYDITGGKYEETNFEAQGSGSKDARDSLKKLWKRDMTRDEALRVAIEALIDAADEDVGTGGPDFIRGIFPTVKTIDGNGFGDVPEADVRRMCETVLADRTKNGNGA
jgi:proteasome beta subunit